MIFCSFYLNQSEFALPVTFVQEVINTPDSFSTIPLAPNYLKGLINLRGTIVPVVDLKDVLGLSTEAGSREQKIAIICLNGNFVGLLFDKTGEVFSSNSDEQSNFLDDDSSVVKGVFKKEGGKRIIQILDAGSIFCLKNLPKQNEDGKLNSNLINNRGKRRQAISFLVGPSKCSLEINEIQEILMLKNINESALAVGNCIGTFDLRGVTVPVIDFAALLKYREADSSKDATLGNRRVVVMKIETELFGLLVDKVDSIVTFYNDELKRFPVFATERMEMIKGCISIKDKEDVLLLDNTKILTDKEIIEITHGHSKLYNAAREASSENNSKKSGIRKTFITFSIEQEYAISISDVREILDLPSNLMTPPGMPAHYRGVFNLRGEMVMVVDSRTMYQKKKQESDLNNKILIFKTEDIHFGLVVDSVHSIISLSENDKMKLPDLMYRDKAGESVTDIVEAVQYKAADETNKAALILDAKRIAKRVLASAV
ncbi:chemotaxis protein CheW [uncultured Bdellovibrio sp.]|uniref:chemotaxis protein CheW n=1 Tax=Bdellovibrio sp. HCB-162 TaxID=3394234 RepID=UPI0025EE3809|nr:chemotaxis protein CheW [uncultured Bdellovibrio sp.]